MLFTPKESLEDTIIRLLSKGKMSPSDLYEAVLNDGKQVTIQALYKALRFLIKASVVVKSGKNMEISQEWINKIGSTFNTQTTLPQLADGEAAVYNYKSLVNLDAYWKHLMSALDEKFGTYPVFLYSPYHIWYHISERTESEAEYFTGFAKKKHFAYFVIGNETELDKNFKKKFQDEFLQIDTWHKSSLKDTSYLTIIGDYIVDTILSKKMTEAIKQYYTSNLPTDQASAELNKVLSSSSPSKIRIERNAKKAKLLRKKLAKNFYIQKELKLQFDLF